MDLDFVQLDGDDNPIGEAHLTDTGVNLARLDSIHIVDGSRGDGHGSELLAAVIASADAEGVTLTLTATPTQDSPFSARGLTKWFGRNGWISDPNDLYAMERQPNPS